MILDTVVARSICHGAYDVGFELSPGVQTVSDPSNNPRSEHDGAALSIAGPTDRQLLQRPPGLHDGECLGATGPSLKDRISPSIFLLRSAD